MEDVVFKIDEFITMAIGLLLGIQGLVVYFLSPEKAAKFNIIGKALDVLQKTKAGLSSDRPN